MEYYLGRQVLSQEEPHPPFKKHTEKVYGLRFNEVYEIWGLYREKMKSIIGND